MVVLKCFLFLILFFAISLVVQVVCEGLSRRWAGRLSALSVILSALAALFLFAGWNRWITMVLFAVTLGLTSVQSQGFRSLSSRFRRMW